MLSGQAKHLQHLAIASRSKIQVVLTISSGGQLNENVGRRILKPPDAASNSQPRYLRVRLNALLADEGNLFVPDHKSYSVITLSKASAASARSSAIWPDG